jgi:L-fuconolactonase
MSSPARPKHVPVREDWLALRSEEAIEPERPIVDAHHHLWDKPGGRYLLDEMLADIGGGHNVVATVFVEGKCHWHTHGPDEMRPVGETDLVAGIAEDAVSRAVAQVGAAIVGYADLRLGEAVGAVLDAHMEAGRGRFRGIRDTSAWHADPRARGSVIVQPAGMLYDPGMRAGLEQLARRKLVFDAWMYHTQLIDVIDLAHDLPQLAIVLNHVGGPIGNGPYAGRRDEVAQDWRHFMARLARFDNVVVKLGGFGMPMTGFDFHDRPLPPTSQELAAAWGDTMGAAIDIFGPERCMFESNFPVDKGTTSYPVLWNAFKKIASRRSEAARDALFLETARRVYGLTCVDRRGESPPQAAETG